MSATGTLDLAGIRARAEAATPGDWRVVPDMRAGSDRSGYEQGPEYCAGYNVNADTCEVIGCEGILADCEANAAHIAGMDPPTTLALVDEVKRGQTHEISLDEGNARCSAEAFRLWKITTEYYEDLCDAIKADAEASAAKLRARVAELDGAQPRGAFTPTALIVPSGSPPPPPLEESP